MLTKKSLRFLSWRCNLRERGIYLTREDRWGPKAIKSYEEKGHTCGWMTSSRLRGRGPENYKKEEGKDKARKRENFREGKEKKGSSKRKRKVSVWQALSKKRTEFNKGRIMPRKEKFGGMGRST